MSKTKEGGAYEEFTQGLIKEGEGGPTKWEKPGFAEKMQLEGATRREIVRNAVHFFALKDSKVDSYAETLIAALAGSVGETWEERVDNALHDFERSVEEGLVEARVKEERIDRRGELEEMGEAHAVSKNIREKLIKKLNELQEHRDAAEDVRKMRKEAGGEKVEAA